MSIELPAPETFRPARNPTAATTAAYMARTERSGVLSVIGKRVLAV